ncbi:hypothetical protein TKK_0011238 [Trichogramma kaykai]|uniref:S1 motif domain-containing protein n=1 Tax=Trichogramma kaykai TaxID=54128 RepID=A0ABD2WT92_9HYME
MNPKYPIICSPGQRLCQANKQYIAGQGTYEELGYIYSKFAGTVKVIEKDETYTIEAHGLPDPTIVPAPGDIITALVTLVNQRFAKCDIKCVGDVTLSKKYRGILRREEVRATEKDRIEMYKSFRPGDIILARVLPMTEAHTFQLTTAEDELGVVIAESAEGAQMVPVSWTEMQCSKTSIREPRKVAKVVPEDVALGKK